MLKFSIGRIKVLYLKNINLNRFLSYDDPSARRKLTLTLPLISYTGIMKILFISNEMATL
jgi:hypothetical protein